MRRFFDYGEEARACNMMLVMVSSTRHSMDNEVIVRFRRKLWNNNPLLLKWKWRSYRYNNLYRGKIMIHLWLWRNQDANARFGFARVFLAFDHLFFPCAREYFVKYESIARALLAAEMVIVMLVCGACLPSRSATLRFCSQKKNISPLYIPFKIWKM